MKTLNFRLLAILLVSTVVCGGAVYALHRYQVGRNANHFLDQARRALDEAEAIEGTAEAEAVRKQERLRHALDNYAWFVRLRPDDIDALEELGGLQMDLLQYPQALDTLNRVVRLDPSRSGARRKLVEVTLAFGRFEDAKTHLQRHLLKEAPEDAELLQQLGICELMAGDTAEAVKILETAVQLDPSQIQAYRYLAIALRFRLKEESKADEWMRRMVEANPESLEARLLAGHYFQTVEAHDEAVTHASKALELEPDNRDGLWLMAQAELGRDNRAAASRFALEGIEKHPDYMPLYAIAADIAMREGRRADAIRRIEDGLEATRRNPQLLWYLGNLRVEAGQLEHAAAVVRELQETDFSPARVTYVEARVDFHRQQWQDAARKFERIRADLMAAWPNLAKQADYWRGRSYQQLGDRKRAEAAYRSSLSIDGSFAAPRAALADLMAAGGELDAAWDQFRRIKTEDTSAAGLVHFARVTLQRTLQAPVEERDWAAFEKLLRDIERTDPRSTHPAVLRAEMLLAQDRPSDAEKVLGDALTQRPDELNLWLARIAVAMRRQQWDEAETVLNEAQSLFQDAMTLRLARARYLVGRYGPKAAGRLRQLAEGIDQYDEQQRQQLLMGLTAAAQQIGQGDLLKQWAGKLVEMQPDNLALHVALFEQAMRENNRDEMDHHLAAIRRIDGEGAQWLYGQAVLLTLAAEGGRDGRLDEALSLLERAKEAQPRWSRVPLLAAGIYERQGRHERALDSYRNAVEMGDANPNAYRRLIQLLAQRGLFEEAQQRMQQFDQLGVEVSSDLERLRGGLLVNVGELDQALEHAQQAAANSENYADHLWLGRLMAGKGQRELSRGNEGAARQLLRQAEEAFLRAIALADDAPDAHLSIIQLYVATGRPELARVQIGRVERDVSAERRPLVLASAYELLGEPEEAEQQYLAAVKEQPADPLRARVLAEFYGRINRMEEAETLARRIIDRDEIDAGDEDRRWARRLLARILAARGGYQNLVAATELIDENLKLDDNETDRRMKVALDQAHPSRQQRDRAIESLERLVAEQREKAPGDQLGLAQLYLAADDWAKAKPLLRDLVTAHPGELRYVATFTEALLSRDETAEAQLYLDQLIEAAPNNFGTVSLQAEALFRNEEYEQVVELLAEFVDRPGAEPDDMAVRLRLIAGHLEQLVGRLREAKQDEWARRFTDAAETLYRRYVQGQPEHELLLAAFLARQGRTVEAVDMFERRWTTLNSANVAQMATILLKSDAATEAHRRRTERIVERAIQETDDPAPLHLIMAEIRTEQERYEEAEKHYRGVLQQHPGHVIALNNLAVLFALQGIQLDEAEQFIHQAIETAGPIASLLDSRATVYSARGEHDKALSDIERAVAENPSPVWLFHGALIHFRAGRKQAAAESLAEAHGKGLTSEMLQPLERPDYQRLQHALKR